MEASVAIVARWMALDPVFVAVTAVEEDVSSVHKLGERATRSLRHEADAELARDARQVVAAERLLDKSVALGAEHRLQDKKSYQGIRLKVVLTSPVFSISFTAASFILNSS